MGFLPPYQSPITFRNHFAVSSDEGMNEMERVGRERFSSCFDFPLDDWQLQAGGAIENGHNVIVCAPTGAGKTVVGEIALRYAFDMRGNKSGIYTTPLKALSNQKFVELTQSFGREDVGLSTGDVSINKNARVRVMTTEVYRNIAWRSSTPDNFAGRPETKDELDANAVVVLDEFHYMGHPGRGGVWEECIITSPNTTQIVGLSATLTNGEDLCAWIEAVTGRKTILVNVPASQRPVPLRYMFATRDGLYPLFRDPDAGPGSPRGMLGYREGPTGDDVKGTKTGFAKEGSIQKKPKAEKLPRGLQVNPALKAETDKRLKKVQKSLERMKVRQRVEQRGRRGYNDFDDEGSQSRRKVKMSPREERREEERLLRKEMRRAVPALHSLVQRLQQKDLLPAIVFLFSRAGCDEAARNLYEHMKGFDPERVLDSVLSSDLDSFDRKSQRRSRRRSKAKLSKVDELLEDKDGRIFRSSNSFLTEETLASIYEPEANNFTPSTADGASPLSEANWEFFSKAGLLSVAEIKEVASRVSAFNAANEEIAFDDDTIEQYLFGVGSHHAGMLPAHKSFVELLYQRQLMKIVVATETLAAGINMPARTTVVMSLAKRSGGSSMSLLDTSNLLQMAGRAGRRGMDTDGTCVIVATPFESHEEAAMILTDQIQPIRSQFSPSYSLAVNLVARGEGELEVARQLVSHSFAMWEERRLNKDVTTAVENFGSGVSDVLELSAQERFITDLAEMIQSRAREGTDVHSKETLQRALSTLVDRETLRKCSKSHVSMSKAIELEEATLNYLEQEAADLNVNTEDDAVLQDILRSDVEDMNAQLSTQQERVRRMRQELSCSDLQLIADIANYFMKESTQQAGVLLGSLIGARQDASTGDISVEELSLFAKGAVSVKRKTNKLKKSGIDSATEALLDASPNLGRSSWDSMLSILKTLVAYGCLTVRNPGDIKSIDMETEQFVVTKAGVNIGMLAFENSLWGLAAMGGVWDVYGLSSSLDAAINPDWTNGSPEERRTTACSKKEAAEMIDILRFLSPHELAGYVACVTSDNSRSNVASVSDVFSALSPLQQNAVDKALQVQARLSAIQLELQVDERTSQCLM